MTILSSNTEEKKSDNSNKNKSKNAAEEDCSYPECHQRGEIITAWLEKRSRHFKSWKKRFIVLYLNVGIIQTYSKEVNSWQDSDCYAFEQFKTEEIEVTKEFKATECENKSGYFGFKVYYQNVENKNTDSFLFRCNNKFAMKEWIRIINEAFGKIRIDSKVLYDRCSNAADSLGKKKNVLKECKSLQMQWLQKNAPKIFDDWFGKKNDKNHNNHINHNNNNNNNNHFPVISSNYNYYDYNNNNNNNDNYLYEYQYYPTISQPAKNHNPYYGNNNNNNNNNHNNHNNHNNNNYNNDHEDNRDEIKRFLYKGCRLGQYYDLFVNNGIINMNTLMLLDENYLKDMGIDNVEHRIEILCAINQLRNDQ